MTVIVLLLAYKGYCILSCSLRSRRDRSADDAIPSVRNPDGFGTDFPTH